MAQATLKIAGDSQKAQDAIVALEKKLDKLEGKLKQTRQQKPVSNSSLSSLTKYAAGLLSVASAAAAAMQALQSLDRMKNESARKQRMAAPGLAELAQVADAKEPLPALIEQARKAFGKGGFDNLDESAGLIFSLKSASIPEKDRQIFIELASSGVARDSASLAKASAALQTSIGQDETGSFNAILSKAFAASSASPSTAPELLGATAKSGGLASRLKITDEEILAATAITATSTSSAAEGGTQVKSLLKTLEKKGTFAGKSLRESLEEIQAMNLQGADLNKYFGTTEALAGFDTILKNLEKYEAIIKNIQQAESGNLAKRKIAMAATVPEIRAVRQATRSENTLENSTKEYGIMRNLRQSVEADIRAYNVQNLGDFGQVWTDFQEGMDYLLDFGRTDRQYLQESSTQQFLKSNNPELYQDVQAILSGEVKRQTAVAEKTLKVLESIDENGKKQKRREFNRNGR